MDWGMNNRMSRLINPETGHAVFLALDHGYFQGPIKKLEEPGKTLKPLLHYADAIMVTRGILRTSVDAARVGPVILRVSGGMTLAGPSLSREGIITSVKEAIRLNASAVALSIHVGTEDEHDTLLSLSRLVDEAEEFGLPVLAVTSVGRELEKREARYLALCCRVAAELGARIVKTYYCEGFEKVVQGCPVPLVIAGGPKMESEQDVLQVAYDAVSWGAAGVDMGRNIFQAESPVGMIRAIRAIVHEGASVKEAAEVLAREKASMKEAAEVLASQNGKALKKPDLQDSLRRLEKLGLVPKEIKSNYIPVYRREDGASKSIFRIYPHRDGSFSYRFHTTQKHRSPISDEKGVSDFFSHILPIHLAD